MCWTGFKNVECNAFSLWQSTLQKQRHLATTCHSNRSNRQASLWLYGPSFLRNSWLLNKPGKETHNKLSFFRVTHSTFKPKGEFCPRTSRHHLLTPLTSAPVVHYTFIWSFLLAHVLVLKIFLYTNYSAVFFLHFFLFLVFCLLDFMFF